MINKNPQEIEELGLPERWSVLLSEGLLAIVFGIIILAWPGISLLVMVTLFGIYAIIDGISAIWLGITGKRSFLFMLVIGLIGVGAGLVILAWPGLTLFALLVIMAVWAIGKGLVQVVSAISRRQEENSWLTGVAGTLSRFRRPAPGMAHNRVAGAGHAHRPLSHTLRDHAGVHVHPA